MPPMEPGRRLPAKGVRIDFDQPTILFVTVCARRPATWLATPVVHELLKTVWQSADAWLIGNYVLMPDHIHLFCAPRDLRFTVEKWISYWKAQFTRLHMNPNWIWQKSAFHHRLRDLDAYREKAEYIRQNPVRKNLVTSPEHWPYTGTIHPLSWK